MPEAVDDVFALEPEAVGRAATAEPLLIKGFQILLPVVGAAKSSVFAGDGPRKLPLQITPRLDGFPVEIVRPQEQAAAHHRHQPEKFDGVPHVIKDPAGNANIKLLRAFPKIFNEVTAKKPCTVDAQKFLGDQTLQEGSGVGLDRDDGGSARILQHIGVPGLERPELQNGRSIHASQRLHHPRDAGIVKERDGASNEVFQGGREPGRPFALKDVHGVLRTRRFHHVIVESLHKV